MAEGKIRVKFEAKDAPELIAAVKSLNRETKRLAGSTRQYEATGQRAARSGKSQAMAFGALGGTLSVLRSKFLLYGFAIQQVSSLLVGATKRAGQFASIKVAFDDLTDSAGFSADAMVELNDAVDGTVSKMDLMKQANNAMLLGIFDSSEQMAEMFDIAQRLGKALGQDTVQSVESLVTGLGRQSKLMLDNLGIVFNVENAYRDYAGQIGKTVDELDDVERKQACVNTAVAKAKELVSDLSDETFDLVDAINLWKSATANFLTETAPNFLTWLGQAVGKFASLGAGASLMDKKMQQLRDTTEDANDVGSGFGEVWNPEQLNALAPKIDEVSTAISVWNPILTSTRAKLEEIQEEGLFNVFSPPDEVLHGLLKFESLITSTEKSSKELTKETYNLARASMYQAGQFENSREAMANAMSGVIRKYIQEAMAAYIADAFAKFGLLGAVVAAGASSIVGGVFARNIQHLTNALTIPEMEQGGLIGGNRHSQGGTMINAERGEFVMSRNAVNAIGVENLNNMNQGSSGGGGVTVNINGGLITPEFVENDLAEAIREGARRGADFGIS